MDQGRNLLRVAIPWMETDETGLFLMQSIADRIKDTPSATLGHVGPLFGLVAGTLRLAPQDAVNVFGYCVARDIVSAAVRLNLIGPLKSVAMLAKAQQAAQTGIEVGCHQGMEIESKTVDDSDLLWCDSPAGGCSPVLDAVAPCHDLLAVRLFRT